MAGTTPLVVDVDAVAYTLSPFGGLIRYWDAVLPRLAGLGGVLRLSAPTPLKAAVPVPLSAGGTGAASSVFLSTYYTPSPSDVPSVVIVHDTIYEDDPTLPVILGDLPDVLARKASVIKTAAVVVCPSHATATGLRRHYPDLMPPIKVVPHGIAAEFSSKADRRGDADARCLLTEAGVTKPYLLHAGGRRAYKGFATLLSASVDLGRRGLQIVVVGSEACLAPDEMALAASGVVVPLGRVDTDVLASLYRGSAAVISPSEAEGFGLVPLEAAACAARVVCTSIPAHRESLEGIAHFFEPGDPVGLVAALDRASAVDRRTLNAAADHLRSSRRFDWDVAAAALMDCLRRASRGLDRRDQQ